MILLAEVRLCVTGSSVAASVRTVIACAIWPSERKGIVMSTMV